MSNLRYLGKLIERAACNQIVDFASRTGNTENNQAAYRVGHSTESVLLKVKSDLLHALNKQEVTCNFDTRNITFKLDNFCNQKLRKLKLFRGIYSQTQSILKHWISL